MKKAPGAATPRAKRSKEDQVNSNIIPITGESPFDRIRQVREDGSEFWSARDLMPLLGYPAWREFRPAIERAMATAHNQGFVAEHLFGVNPENTGGRPRENFHLARVAAYLVAMNGDPRKPEVAAAQAYFAVKTREAETAKPVQELTFAEKTLEVMAGLQQMVEAQRVENEKQAKQLEVQKPIVARMKNYQTHERSQNRQKFARDICKALREQLGIEAIQPDVQVFLSRRLNLFIAGKRSDAGEATAWAERNFYAETRRATAENGHNYSQGKLTPRGYEYAWARIFAYAEANGHIRLEGERSA